MCGRPATRKAPQPSWITAGGFGGLGGTFAFGCQLLPGAFGALGLRQVAVAQAIVEAGLAYRAEALIVEADSADALLQFFGELMQRLQVIGGGRIDALAGLQHLLIAVIDELGNFSVDEIAGIGEYLYPAVAGAFDRRRALILLQKYAIPGAGRLGQLEAMAAKP